MTSSYRKTNINLSNLCSFMKNTFRPFEIPNILLHPIYCNISIRYNQVVMSYKTRWFGPITLTLALCSNNHVICYFCVAWLAFKTNVYHNMWFNYNRAYLGCHLGKKEGYYAPSPTSELMAWISDAQWGLYEFILGKGR